MARVENSSCSKVCINWVISCRATALSPYEASRRELLLAKPMAILYYVAGAPSRADAKELPRFFASVFCAQTTTMDVRVRIR